MESVRERISSTQLTYLVIGFVIGSSLVLPPATGLKQDGWIAIIIGLAEGMLVLWLLTSLSRRFPGRTLVEISREVFGRYLGTVVAVLYVWFFFHLGSLVIGNFGDFFAAALMVETPVVVFALTLTLLCGYAVAHGLEVVARCSQVLVPITFFTVLTTIVLLYNQYDFTHLLPLFESPWTQIVWGAHGAAVFPFAETVAFFMLVPFVNKEKQAPKAIAIGLLLGGLILLLGVLRNRAVLGPSGNISTYPSFHAVRMIEVGRFLTRVEVIVAINLQLMGFIKISVLYLAAVIGLAQILGLKSYRSIVVPIGLLLVVLSIRNFSSVAENIETVQIGWPIYAPIFEMLLPLITLIVAVVRKLPKKEAARR